MTLLRASRARSNDGQAHGARSRDSMRSVSVNHYLLQLAVVLVEMLWRRRGVHREHQQQHRTIRSKDGFEPLVFA